MLSARLGVVKSADGSCRLRSRAGVSVIAYANGPTGAGGGPHSSGGFRSGTGGGFALQAGAATLHLSLLTASGPGAGARSLKAAEGLISDCLRHCLLLSDYPNLHIFVTAALLEASTAAGAGNSGGVDNSSSISAALLTACTLALLDAGLSMARIPLACAHEGCLIVGDNLRPVGGPLLACWGRQPVASWLAADGPVTAELLRIEKFMRRACERRVGAGR